MNTQRGNAGQGNDLRTNLEISLEDAFKGSSAQIKIPTSLSCEVCSGTGAKAGTQPVNCPTCRGAGKVRAQQGFFTIERTCPTCQGAGKIIREACDKCGGKGAIRREKTLKVKIPQGVDTGRRIRLTLPEGMGGGSGGWGGAGGA